MNTNVVTKSCQYDELQFCGYTITYKKLARRDVANCHDIRPQASDKNGGVDHGILPYLLLLLALVLPS